MKESPINLYLHYESFSKWLDNLLSQDLPDEIIAFNFNLYEGCNETYDAELIGTDEFDQEDEDWACSEIYSSGDCLFSISKTDNINYWEKGLEVFSALIKRYLNEGNYSSILKSKTGIGAGFTDGDIEILYMS